MEWKSSASSGSPGFHGFFYRAGCFGSGFGYEFGACLRILLGVLAAGLVLFVVDMESHFQEFLRMY